MKKGSKGSKGGKWPMFMVGQLGRGLFMKCHREACGGGTEKMIGDNFSVSFQDHLMLSLWDGTKVLAVTWTKCDLNLQDVRFTC